MMKNKQVKEKLETKKYRTVNSWRRQYKPKSDIPEIYSEEKTSESAAKLAVSETLGVAVK